MSLGDNSMEEGSGNEEGRGRERGGGQHRMLGWLPHTLHSYRPSGGFLPLLLALSSKVLNPFSALMPLLASGSRKACIQALLGTLTL